MWICSFRPRCLGTHSPCRGHSAILTATASRPEPRWETDDSDESERAKRPRLTPQLRRWLKRQLAHSCREAPRGGGAHRRDADRGLAVRREAGLEHPNQENPNKIAEAG